MRLITEITGAENKCESTIDEFTTNRGDFIVDKLITHANPPIAVVVCGERTLFYAMEDEASMACFGDYLADTAVDYFYLLLRAQITVGTLPVEIPFVVRGTSERITAVALAALTNKMEILQNLSGKSMYEVGKEIAAWFKAHLQKTLYSATPTTLH